MARVFGSVSFADVPCTAPGEWAVGLSGRTFGFACPVGGADICGGKKDNEQSDSAETPPPVQPPQAVVVPAELAGGEEEEEGGEEEQYYYEEEEGGEEEEAGEEEGVAGEEEEGAGEEEEEGAGEEEEEAGELVVAPAADGAGREERAMYARCVYDYAAEKEGDLSLKTGDIVTMSSKQDFAGDWLYGAVGDSAPGFFPSSFVKLVTEAEATGEGPAAKTVAAVAGEALTDSQLEDKQPAQSGWRLERDQLKTRLGAQEQAEQQLRAEVAALERQRGGLLKEIAELEYGAGRGKGGCQYDMGKLQLGTFFETESMGQAVDSSTEMCRQLKEFSAALEKGFEKEKDVAPEKEAAQKSIATVVASGATELAAISALSNTKDKFSHVLKGLQDKVAAEPE